MDKILPLIETGHVHFGENKVQEAELKWKEIKKKHLNIKNKVVIESSGTLNGNIEASIITIEEGANFDGMCNMLKSNESAVQKISAI